MATEYRLSYSASEVEQKLNEIDSIKSDLIETVKCTKQSLTEEQKAQARENIGAVSIEEVEDMLGIEEEFSVTGELVEFDFDVEPDTDLQVISKIHRDETWGVSNKLVLHQVSGNNFVDFTNWLGGAGKVFEKNGLTATINDDGTVTITGTNTSTGWSYPINKAFWSGEHSEKVYPAGTYTLPENLMIGIRAAKHPNNVAIEGFTSAFNGTRTIPVPFRIAQLQYAVKGGATVDVTIPLGLFGGNTIPETDYEYNGQLHTVTFDSPVYEGEFNWSTGELKDVDGNTVRYYDAPKIKRLSGTNYFWTGFGENTVSNMSSNSGKVVLRLNESAPEDTIPSICDFMLTPTTSELRYSLHSDKILPGYGTNEFNGHEIPLVTTKGTLAVVDAQNEIITEKYIDTLINWQGVSDTLTNKGVHKVWSEKFYFTKEPIAREDFSYDGGATNSLYTFEFTEEDFLNNGLPAKLDNIPIVSPCFYTSADASSKLNQRVWGNGVFPATLSWDASSEKYIFKVRGLHSGYIMAQLQKYTKAYLYYQLETPYDKSETFCYGRF